MKKVNKKWHQRNTDARNERRRKAYALNPDSVLEYNQRYRKENAERLKEWRKQNYLKNREKFLDKSAKYRKEHMPEIVERFIAYKNSDPNVALRYSLRSRMLSAMKKRYKSGSTLELVGIHKYEKPWDFLQKWFECQFQPGMSWENRSEWHIDHKRPCASFDLTDPVQQRECFHWSNLQPLWAFDNLSKGCKT